MAVELNSMRIAHFNHYRSLVMIINILTTLNKNEVFLFDTKAQKIKANINKLGCIKIISYLIFMNSFHPFSLTVG